jgi:hypothetical protein
VVEEASGIIAVARRKVKGYHERSSFPSFTCGMSERAGMNYVAKDKYLKNSILPLYPVIPIEKKGARHTRIDERKPRRKGQYSRGVVPMIDRRVEIRRKAKRATRNNKQKYTVLR